MTDSDMVHLQSMLIDSWSRYCDHVPSVVADGRQVAAKYAGAAAEVEDVPHDPVGQFDRHEVRPQQGRTGNSRRTGTDVAAEQYQPVRMRRP